MLMGTRCIASVFTVLLIVVGSQEKANAQVAVRRPIISIAGSSHGCPCPYDKVVQQDGTVYHCGQASSWSRPGGWEPTCYTSDYPSQIMRGGNITDWVDVMTSCYADTLACRVQ